MRLKKWLFVLLTAVLFIAIFYTTNSKESLELMENNSYFKDFAVKGERVYIRYMLQIRNSYKEDKEFYIAASLPEDIASGLLEKERIYALDIDFSKKRFFIRGSTTEILDVTFVGEYAWNNKKADRNLPASVEFEIIR